jgi:predicted DCC family thiol-disulfide oxidoreductase YuxK
MSNPSPDPRPLVSVVPESRETSGWILYDARCPICRRGARRLGGIATARGFRLVPLQRRSVRDLLARRAQPVPDAMLLLLPGGELLHGVDAFARIASRVWWAAPLAPLAAVPGLRFLLRRLYAWIAAHRYGISRACGLDGRRTCRAGG